MQYFKGENGYVGLTGECPKGMDGAIYMGRGPVRGFGIESVCEQPYPVAQLQKMEQVKPEDVPDDWFDAIGLEERPEPEPEPEPEPKKNDKEAKEKNDRKKGIVMAVIMFAFFLSFVLRALL